MRKLSTWLGKSKTAAFRSHCARPADGTLHRGVCEGRGFLFEIPNACARLTAYWFDKRFNCAVHICIMKQIKKCSLFYSSTRVSRVARIISAYHQFIIIDL